MVSYGTVVCWLWLRSTIDHLLAMYLVLPPIILSEVYNHCVRLVVPAPALQCFPLTSLQLQPPATSQVTVFFSHTTLAPAFSSSLPNRVSS